jgi:hypothetical protein
MNSPNSTRPGREHAGRAARLAHGARDEKPATVKITCTVTSDSPNGQPWPPPDRDVLWVVARSADGSTLWRSIQLAQVQAAATDLAFPDRQQLNLKDYSHDPRRSISQ